MLIRSTIYDDKYTLKSIIMPNNLFLTSVFRLIFLLNIIAASYVLNKLDGGTVFYFFSSYII